MKNLIVLSAILMKSFSLSAEVLPAHYSGTGRYNDQHLQVSENNKICELSFLPRNGLMKSDEEAVRLRVGSFQGVIKVQKALKILGTPLFDYSGFFKTNDNREGEIQITIKDSGKNLQIWSSIQKSRSEVFASQTALIRCSLKIVNADPADSQEHVATTGADVETESEN